MSRLLSLATFAVVLVNQATEAFVAPPYIVRPYRPSENTHVVARNVFESASAGGFDLAVISLNTLDTNQLLAAGAAAVVLAAAVAAITVQQSNQNTAPTTMKGPEPEPEPIDVSIPYDAAARLAFEASGVGKDESKYAKFKTVYEKKAVAEVMASRYAREMDTLCEIS